MKRLIQLALAAAVAWWVPAPAAAHPHVWIDVACAFLFDAEGRATGIVESWSFDEMYSSFAVTGLPRGTDGRIAQGKLAELAKTIVGASGERNHFTTAAIGGRTLALGDASEQSAEFGAGGRLVVRFRLDLAAPQAVGADKLRVEVHDPDLYADFRFSPPTEKEAASLPAGCAVTLDDPKAHLPKDPEAVMRALIDGPLVPLTSGLELACR